MIQKKRYGNSVTYKIYWDLAKELIPWHSLLQSPIRNNPKIFFKSKTIISEIRKKHFDSKTILISFLAFLRSFEMAMGKLKTLAACWHKYHVTIFFLRLSGFGDHSWICKQAWDLDKNICGSSNFIKISQKAFFLGLINCSKWFPKNIAIHIFFPDFKVLFGEGRDFKNILGLLLIGFRIFPRKITRNVRYLYFVLIMFLISIF